MSCGLQRIGLYTVTNQNYIIKNTYRISYCTRLISLLRLNSYYHNIPLTILLSVHLTLSWMDGSDGLMLILENPQNTEEPHNSQLLATLNLRLKILSLATRVRAREKTNSEELFRHV